MTDTNTRYCRILLALKFKKEFVKYDRDSQQTILNLASSWINEQKDNSEKDNNIASWLSNNSSHLDSKNLNSISNPLCMLWGPFIYNEVPHSLNFEKYLLFSLEYMSFGEDLR